MRFPTYRDIKYSGPGSKGCFCPGLLFNALPGANKKGDGGKPSPFLGKEPHKHPLESFETLEKEQLRDVSIVR